MAEREGEGTMRQMARHPGLCRWVMLMAFAGCFGLVGRAAADAIPATSADQPIVPGEWHLGLDKALALAKDTGIPVLGFWANTGCSHCSEVIRQAVNTSEFTAWRQRKQLLMVTGEGRSGLAGELYAWTKTAASDDGDLSYPFIRIYWVKRDGTVQTDYRFSGYPYGSSAQTLIGKIESDVADFSYHGQAVFGFTGDAEIEPASPAVPLPLVRHYGDAGMLTNTLSFTRTLESGGVTNWTESLIWADGETNRNVFVANEGHAVGGTVTVTLSAPGETDQMRVLSLVGEQETDIHNPRFVGEPFNFGEWTMDLDAATNAVAQSTDEGARTMILFTAMWCPYCAGFEDDVLQSQAFKELARTNHLALTVISIPSRDGLFAGSPLTHNVFTNAANSADRRIGLNGTSYMTRHGITPEAGWARIEQILAFERQLTLPDKTFVNLPAVVMLRKDGSIASRIPGYYCFNYSREGTVYPPYMRFQLECNMTRLHEQLAMTQDARVFDHEENNNYAAWTCEALGLQSPLDETLAANDEADYFTLGAVDGTEQRVTLTGADPVRVALSICSNGVSVANASGLLTEGVSAAAPVSTAAVYQVCVRTNDAAFSFTNTVSTLHAYHAETTVTLDAHESASSLRVASATNAVGVFATTMTVLAGECYRFATVGSQLALPSGAFEAVAGEPDVYRALAGGSVALSLKADSPEGTFSWQLWRPGTVGFAQTNQTVSETAESVEIAVGRSDGGSGSCSVRIDLDPGQTTATAGEDFDDLFASGVVLVWADGETGTKSFTVPLRDDAGYEGDETLALTLAVTEGSASAAEGRTNTVVSLVENDTPTVGRLMFSKTGGFFARTSPLTVIATEGGQMLLGVSRVDGMSLAVTGLLSITAGEVAPDTLTWANNDRVSMQYVTVDLPMLAEVPRGVVTVKLASQGKVGVVSSKKTVTVRLIAENAPLFAATEVVYTAQKDVAFAQSVPLLQTEDGKVSLSRLSGALPSGIAAAYDGSAGTMKLSGVPRRSGTFVAVFQVSETRSGKRVAGGVVQVTITVVTAESVNAAATNAVSAAEGAVLDSNTPVRVVGTLTYSVSTSGRATARYRSRKGSVSFSAANWSFCDESGVLTSAMKKGDYGLEVSLAPDGALSARVTDPDYDYPLTATLAASGWSSAHPATAYKGYYTVVLSPAATTGALAPLGHSFMTISLTAAATKTGRATYSGYLANGTPYSGSARLQPREDGTAQMVIFASAAKYTLSGIFLVVPDAVGTYTTYPSAITAHDGTATLWEGPSGYAETAYTVGLNVFGGYYSSGDSLLSYYERYTGTGPFRIQATDVAPASEVHGAATALPSVALTVSDLALRVAAGSDNPTRLALSFSKRNGIFRGTMRLPFARPDQTSVIGAGYTGVLLPGWYGPACETGCADNEGELPHKPFGMGAYWFRDKCTVEKNSREVLIPVNVGYPLVIEKDAE